MKDLSVIIKLLESIWKEPLCFELSSKRVDVAKYSKLKNEIPDEFIVIEEIFPKDELETIWNNFEPYLNEYKIFPFLGTLGEAVLCIGYEKSNRGKIFYFDFDFGCIELDDDDLNKFVSKLVDS